MGSEGGQRGSEGSETRQLGIRVWKHRSKQEKGAKEGKEGEVRCAKAPKYFRASKYIWCFYTKPSFKNEPTLLLSLQLASPAVPFLMEEHADELPIDGTADEARYSPLLPESIALPPHWHRYYDEDHEAYYYHNELDQTSQWEYPLDDEMVLYEEPAEPVAYQPYFPFSPEVRQHSPHQPRQPEQPPHLPLPLAQLHQNDHEVEHEHEPIDEVAQRVREVQRTQHYPGGRNKDYLAAATAYRFQRHYSDAAAHPVCLLCHLNEPVDVFFPCGHRCVCAKCIRQEHICDEATALGLGGVQKDPDGYFMCSLCAEVIKIILPFEGGKEEQKYWDWVYEEKVSTLCVVRIWLCSCSCWLLLCGAPCAALFP